MACQSHINVWIHYVWSTKYHAPLITPSLKPVLYRKIRSIANERHYHLDFINGMPDHVHLLVSLNSVTKICEIPKMLKGASSRWVNEQGLTRKYFRWQDGYGAISVSPDRIPTVRNYIKKQEIHHQSKTYDEELRQFRMYDDI